MAVDANGADLGPAEVAAGARLAASAAVEPVLFGPLEELGEGIEAVDAPLSVAKAPEPVRAVRSNPEASIVQAAAAVGEGRAAALVCAGATGAALAAALLRIGRLGGVKRPALALPLPQPLGERELLLLDVGANADCRPEQLAQFAVMGAAFVRAVWGLAQPQVALLSNGSEPDRGSEVVVEAHRRLAELARAGVVGFEFVGNVEGTGLFAGAADVVVCDGFAGNVALKTAEGVSAGLLQAIRASANANPLAKVGGALLLPALKGLRERADPERHGGAYLLGLKAPVVVAHGRFSRRGFAAAIQRAAAAVKLPELIAAELKEAGLTATAIRSAR